MRPLLLLLLGCFLITSCSLDPSTVGPADLPSGRKEDERLESLVETCGHQKPFNTDLRCPEHYLDPEPTPHAEADTTATDG